MPDAEYKIEQTITADSEILVDVNNAEENPYTVSLELSASGNAATQLTACESGYSSVTESNARLGGAINFSYTEGEVDKVKLTYQIADEYILTENSKYDENFVDFSGIKRYNIFRYFEDINMLLPVATEFDVENNILYAETDELGTYCVLDMEILLQNLGIAPDGTQTETVMAEYYSAAELSEASVLAVSDETTEAIDSPDTSDSAEKYYVTFIIDVRQDALDDLTKIKEQISEFAETAYIEGKDVSIRLLPQGAFDFTADSDTYSPEEIAERTYTSLEAVNEALDDIKIEDDNEYFGNYYQLTDVLSEVINVSEYSNHNFIFNIYSQTDAVYEQNNINTLLETAAENSVSISAITTEYPLEGFQSEMIADSNGTHIVGYATIADEVYEHVFNGVYVEKEALPVILATGYQKVILDSKLYPNGYWGGVGTDADTDRDTITDWDEVKTELLTINGIGDYELPTVRQCVAELSKVPFYVEGALDRDDIIYRYWGCKVLPINSDPTCEDGDGDELSDSEEYDLGTSPINGDTDHDDLWDGEEYYIGTDLLHDDTDNDGLSDSLEVDLWFDPLNSNVDGDTFNDYDEWINDTNPYVYDYTASEQALEFLQGAALGDFDEPDNIPQLLGQVAGSFVPFVADARDYFANVFKNLDTLSAVLCLGGFLLDLAPGLGSVGDAAKAAPKVVKFAAKYADDTSKVIEAISQVSKQISKNDDALSTLAKSLPLSTLDDIAESANTLDKVTKADFTRLLDILKSAGYKGDNLLGAVIKNTDDYIPQEVLQKMRAVQKNFKEEDVLFAIESNFDMPYGKLLWLEIGNDNVGLKHIMKRNHIIDLNNKGISDDEIIPVLRDLLLNHKPLDYKTITLKNGHIRYDVYYMYNSNEFVVGIGDNGFIVNFLPRKMK